MISVCMATYNGSKYIESQLLSILNQLSLDDEIIISDDGSSDNTLSIIASLRDSRIKVIEHSRTWLPENTPVITRVKKSFECALKLASGDYIFLSDQDDEWLPERVSSSLKYLVKDFNLVVSNCVVVDEDDNVLFSSYYDLISPSDKLLRTIQKSSFHGCCMAFNRNMLKYIQPFPDKNIGHDTWIGMVCILKGRVRFIEQPYIKYRRHNNTVTQCGFKSNRPLMVKIKYRVDLVVSILARALKNG